MAHTPAPFAHGLPPPSWARPRSSSCPQACAPQTAGCPQACPGISTSPPGGGWALTHCGVCPSPRLLRAPPPRPSLSPPARCHLPAVAAAQPLAWHRADAPSRRTERVTDASFRLLATLLESLVPEGPPGLGTGAPGPGGPQSGLTAQPSRRVHTLGISVGQRGAPSPETQQEERRGVEGAQAQGSGRRGTSWRQRRGLSWSGSPSGVRTLVAFLGRRRTAGLPWRSP